MYAKLLPNGSLMTAPNKIRTEDALIYNPPGYLLLERGYKPLQYVDMPTDATEGYHYEAGWSDEDNYILQTWELVEDSDEIDDADAFAIIMGGEIE